MSEFSASWSGDELILRGQRALARATIAWGEHTSAAMKEVAHVISGDLRNSIHAAGAENAEGSPEATEDNVVLGDQGIVEVGSWLPYACVEENRGGEHRFATRGYEATAGIGIIALEKAFEEEGL